MCNKRLLKSPFTFFGTNRGNFRLILNLASFGRCEDGLRGSCGLQVQVKSSAGTSAWRPAKQWCFASVYCQACAALLWQRSVTGGLWLSAKHHQARLLPSPLLGTLTPHLNDSTARHYRTWSQCFPQCYQHSLELVWMTWTNFHVGTRKSVQWKAWRVPNARNDILIIFPTESFHLTGPISSCVNNCCTVGLRLAYASIRLHFYRERMILCSLPSTIRLVMPPPMLIQTLQQNFGWVRPSCLPSWLHGHTLASGWAWPNISLASYLKD